MPYPHIIRRSAVNWSGCGRKDGSTDNVNTRLLYREHPTLDRHKQDGGTEINKLRLNKKKIKSKFRRKKLLLIKLIFTVCEMMDMKDDGYNNKKTILQEV